MARHTPDVDAREIDADRARGRIIGTAMTEDPGPHIDGCPWADPGYGEPAF